MISKCQAAAFPLLARLLFRPTGEDYWLSILAQIAMTTYFPSMVFRAVVVDTRGLVDTQDYVVARYPLGLGVNV